MKNEQWAEVLYSIAFELTGRAWALERAECGKGEPKSADVAAVIHRAAALLKDESLRLDPRRGKKAASR